MVTHLTPDAPRAEWALAYADAGLPVHPLHWTDAAGRCACDDPGCGRNAGKHPLTPHGFHDATTDRRVIAGWWGRWPLANIGIPTGPAGGLYVVDVDSTTPAGAQLARELARDALLLTSTMLIATPGKPPDYVAGLHVWLWSEADQPTAGLGIGELKGRGGYVLAPPSTRAGRPYRVLARAQLIVADPLAWTRELLTAFDVRVPERAPGPALGDGWAAEWLRTALAAGQRRAPDGLPRLVGYLRGHGIDVETACAILELWDSRNPDPLGPDEVRRHVAAMYARYGMPAQPCLRLTAASGRTLRARAVRHD